MTKPKLTPYQEKRLDKLIERIDLCTDPECEYCVDGVAKLKQHIAQEIRTAEIETAKSLRMEKINKQVTFLVRKDKPILDWESLFGYNQAVQEVNTKIDNKIDNLINQSQTGGNDE